MASARSPAGAPRAVPRDHGNTLPLREVLEVELIRTIEQQDRDGRFVSSADRARAAHQVRRSGAQRPAEVLAARAALLMPVVTARAPWLAPLARPAIVPGWAAGAIVAAAAGAGLASNALGPAGVINLLAVPLLGVLAWNAAVYLVLIARAVSRGAPPAGLTSIWSALVWRMAERRSAHEGGGSGSSVDRIPIDALVDPWRRAALPVAVARTRALLHMAAAAMASGLTIGMYVRGIVFEYRATWESTFLGQAQVHALLVAVLGPAAALSGRSVPGPDALALIRAPASGEAASWVHLYAITLLLWVIGPRLALAGFAAMRARRAAAAVPLNLLDPYFRRVLAEHRGEATRVCAVPYSHALSGATAAVLRERLQAAEGAVVDLDVLPSLSYGAEPEALADVLRTGTGAGQGERWIALVTSLAQPPEPEVHGELLREALARATAAGDRLLLVVDAAEYARRLGTGPVAEQRLAQRREAWDRVAALARMTPLHVDLGGPAPVAASRLA